MAVRINVLVFLVVLSSFGEAQNYFLGEDTSQYLSDGFTEPPVPYYETDQLQSGNYYLTRDLQTSELPTHLQQTLPQYQHHFAPKETFSSIIPIPFRLSSEYVEPSTHRPDYSHLLSQPRYDRLIPYQKNARTNRFEAPSSSDLEEVSNETEIKRRQEQAVATLAKSPDKNLESKINPVSSKENDNKLDLNKRDSVEDAKEEVSGDEYSDPPEEEASDPKGKENNQLDDSEYDEEYEYDDEDYDEIEEKNPKNETYEVLTMKPMTTNSANMFNDFVDVDTMDTTTQVPATSNIFTQPPIPMTTLELNGDKKHFPELVVSVVTSKTIVNNTVIAPIAFDPLNVSTEAPMRIPVENSTDSWIVIASVQTSRSISGTRYIPSSVVDQSERIHLLNEPNLATEPTMPGNTDDPSEIDPTAPMLPSTVAKTRTSTESLIDKLDRVQSDLSSGLLAGGYKNDNIAVIEENLSTKLETTTEEMIKNVTTKAPYPQVNIRKFNAGNRSSRPKPKGPPATKPVRGQNVNRIKDPNAALRTSKPIEDLSSLLPPGYTPPRPATSTEIPINNILSKAKPVNDISALLPPGYKPPTSASNEKPLEAILSKAKPVDDISALLPPGYKPPQTTEKIIRHVFSKAKPVDDISALLPPGYKPPQSATTEKAAGILAKAKPVDDLSALLPPGYKPPQPTSTLAKAKPVDDLGALLPPGYKPPPADTSKNLFNKAKPVDISSLLPPGYKPSQSGPSEKSKGSLLTNAKPVEDISALLPPGYKKAFSKPPKATTASSVPLETVSQSMPSNLLPPGFKSANENIATSTAPTSSQPAPPASGAPIKLVFPSRPGGGARKTPRLTTPRAQTEDTNKATSPIIQKGWPVRASTEFTGWPTPSTTPISIEKLLEAARKAATSTTTAAPTEPPSTTTTTTTTTTTPRPTTPGICVDDCDLAGTIKLVAGAKWAPELLDPNTKEYQILANSVQSELETIYNNSPDLKQWYRKIRIDGFSEGSILVDYLVEFNEIGQKVSTQEIKRLFHESLVDVANGSSNREGKSLNDSKAERISLGQFEVDPKYTDFIVIPKQLYPTVGFADDVLLPQWAIAVIVIGLASLLFVIIFGVTVLFNRHKNSKKTPAPLTEDMLNELNKNHMGGLENYGVDDDFYNMEDVWSDKHYEQKPPKKRTNNNGSLYDNSTSNLYDSWRSQWNGQWNAYNTYYGNANSSQHSGHSGMRRPPHDTNF